MGPCLASDPEESRGVSLESLLACSPEVGAHFSLHWFQVDPSLFRHLGDDPRATLRQLSGEEHLYPCHPWEVQRILGNPLVQRAMSRGLMAYRGALGAPLYPTSSVRTLYHPELAYFLKFSVHVRLTNCIRKNAWYELHSAVALTRLLRPAMADLARHQPGFELMPEPAASTLDLSALGSAEQAREVTECFGILYRGNFDAGSREAYRPQVAMALFTWGLDGHGMCASRLRQCAARLGLGREETAALWLQRYAGLLLGGVLHCLYRQGWSWNPICRTPCSASTTMACPAGSGSATWKAPSWSPGTGRKNAWPGSTNAPAPPFTTARRRPGNGSPIARW